MEQSNPFSDFGTTIRGDRFIGREEEISQIHNRLFGDVGYGSMALVGLPRIGKTSLLAEAVRRADSRLKRIRAVVVRINIGTCQSVDELFRSMIVELLESIREEGWSNELIESGVARALDKTEMAFPLVREVFRQIRQAGIRAVCILDEFDSGRYLFLGKPQCFHWFRELCSNPDFKAAVVLISKRRLQDVASMAGHDSNYWANVLTSMTLCPFTADEREDFFNRIEDLGVSTASETSAEIAAVCGEHPFLLDAYAYHAWEGMTQGHTLGLDWLRVTMRGVLRDYYQQVVTILRDASILDKFVQVFIGPQWNVGPDDVDAMVDYGLISFEYETRLRTFSEGFEDYVRFVEGSVEMWPLWRDTERVLRDSIETLLQKRFDEGWPEELMSARPKLRGLIEECQGMMEKEQARFGARAASSLLAYTYPMDLFRIMAADWPALGEPLLGSDKQGWSIKFGVLAKVRTPLAHNREGAVKEGVRLQAEGICREILERKKSWETDRGA